MDIVVNDNNMEGNPSAPDTTVVQFVKGLARRVIGFFILSKEEQAKAGIYLGSEGRDDQTDL